MSVIAASDGDQCCHVKWVTGCRLQVWSLVVGSWLAFGIWNLAFGIWHLAFGIWHLPRLDVAIIPQSYGKQLSLN